MESSPWMLLKDSSRSFLPFPRIQLPTRWSFPETTQLRRKSMSETPEKIVRSEAEWRALLTEEQYQILREKDTERPFTGALTENHETGNYHCAGCGTLLFLSDAKFDSGCGWPSFMLPADSKVIDEHEDLSLGRRRTEVTCARCGGHLGHVFADGPKPTGLRYCINSGAITFTRPSE
jgi:peptide-methionine (R)-S-oxide reductase